MKKFLLRVFTGITLKNAVAVAHQVAALAVDAIRAMLMSDGISDERRKQLQIVFQGAIALRDFLEKLAQLVGAPAMSSISSLSHLSDKASQLERITEHL